MKSKTVFQLQDKNNITICDLFYYIKNTLIVVLNNICICLDLIYSIKYQAIDIIPYNNEICGF